MYKMYRNIKENLSKQSNDYSQIEQNFYSHYGKSLLFDSCPIDKKKITKPLSGSIVIPAWNVEDTILSCLAAIELSSFNQKFSQDLQVIVVDDGSTDHTLSFLKQRRFSINLTVVQQDNHGQGPAMNAGISAAEGEIVIEVDADTILNRYAIENLMSRHYFYKDALYTGFRDYVDADDPRVSLNNIKTNMPDPSFCFSTDERVIFPVAGWPSNMCLASNHYKRLGHSKGLWMPNDDNNDPWRLADMVFGMLFSLPRNIFNKIGGFDDRFEGWGCDDGYVGAKAVSEGMYVIPVYTATGYHISHPFRTEDKQAEYDFNRKFFFEFINSTHYEGHPDWISIAKKRILHKFVKNNAIENNYEGMSSELKQSSYNFDQLLLLGRYDDVLNLLENKATDANKHLYYAKALLGIMQYSKCVSFVKSISNFDSSKDLLFLAARAEAGMGNFVTAKKYLEKISVIDSSYPDLDYWLYKDPLLKIEQGEKYYHEGFFDLAKGCFEAALCVDPTNIEALKLRDKCLVKH